MEPSVIIIATWSFYFVSSKFFKPHAILHDAAETVRSDVGEEPSYCYMVGKESNSCLRGHVTGLLFCLDVKLFLLSVFNSGDFWSNMSSIVPDAELADTNVLRKLGLLF